MRVDSRVEGGEQPLGDAILAEPSPEATYTAVFRSEFASVLRTTYALVGDVESARDITQEAFARLYANWVKVSVYDRPGAWVRRVAIRLAVKSQRRSLRERMSSAREEVPATPEAFDPDLARAVRSLPAGERAAIVLFYLDDRSIADVAELLRCSESAVKVRLHRGRKRLAELLGEEVDDVGG